MRLTLLVLALTCVITSPIGAADNDSVADLRRDLERLSKRLDETEAKLQSARERIEQLEMRHASPQGGNEKKRVAADTVKEKPIQAPLGTVWKGKFFAEVPQDARMEVITRAGVEATLRITLENKAVWDFDCKMDGNKCEITKTRRVRAAEGVADPAIVSNVVGGGQIDGRKLTFKYDWRTEAGVRRLSFSGVAEPSQ